MYYALKPEYGLRTWTDVPFAIVMRSNAGVIHVTRQDFFRLLQADTLTEMDDRDAIVQKLCRQGFIKRCEYAAAKLDAWQKYRVFNNSCMTLMNLAITAKCNYNCRHCFNAKDNGTTKYELSIQEINRLLAEAYECGIVGITLTGGEPLLHPNIRDILDEIYRKGMFVGELNTNGSLVTQSFLDYLKKFPILPKIKISFDGIGYHDWMRNHTDAEKKAIDAIRLCHTNGFEVMAQINVNEVNLAVIPKTLDFLDRLGVNEARLIRTTEAPRWYENGLSMSIPIDEYYQLIYAILEEYLGSTKKMSLDIWQVAQIDPGRKVYVFPFYMNRKPPNGLNGLPFCKMIKNMIAISASGEIAPCMQMVGWLDKYDIHFGNIKQQNLQSLLQAGPYYDFIHMTKQARLIPGNKCNGCKYWEKCLGGCPCVSGLTCKDPEDHFAVTGPDAWKCVFYENEYDKQFMQLFSDYGYTMLP